MAIAIITEMPGGTAEQDDAMQQQLGLASNPPAGVMLRMAGPVAGGWRIISVWQSQEAFDVFRRDRLEPALREAGRPVPRFESAPLHSVNVIAAPTVPAGR